MQLGGQDGKDSFLGSGLAPSTSPKGANAPRSSFEGRQAEFPRNFNV